MKYKVKIRDNDTNEIRIADMGDLDWDRTKDKGNIFWWTEGNFGCDCNRGMIFQDDRSLDVSCNSGKNRYQVIEAIFENGDIIEIDGD